MNSKPIALFAAVALAAVPGAAMAGNSSGKSAPDPFGEANRQTMMAQIIDPEPQYTKPMATDAEHAVKAVERYRTDSTKTPEKIRTSGGSGGGGGGS